MPAEAGRLAKLLKQRPYDSISLPHEPRPTDTAVPFQAHAGNIATGLLEKMLATQYAGTRLIGLFNLIRESFFSLARSFDARANPFSRASADARRIAAHLACYHLPLAEHVEYARSILESCFYDEDQKVRDVELQIASDISSPRNLLSIMAWPRASSILPHLEGAIGHSSMPSSTRPAMSRSW